MTLPAPTATGAQRPPVARRFDELVARARLLLDAKERRLLGIAGPPGSGKSTLAQRLARALGGMPRLVPMDGFHLSNAQLERLGRSERKGAIDTFDAHGYVALLRRLRERPKDTVYAPEFRRSIEEPIAGAIAIDASAPLIITEGNYVLVEAEPWRALRSLLDEIWFFAPDEDARIAQLIARHISYGKSAEQARAWALGPDQRNAELVATTRHRADVVVALDGVGA